MYGEALLHRQDCEDDDDDGTHGKGYDGFDVVNSASAGHRLVNDCRKEGCEDLQHSGRAGKESEILVRIGI